MNTHKITVKTFFEVIWNFFRNGHFRGNRIFRGHSQTRMRLNFFLCARPERASNSSFLNKLKVDELLGIRN